MPQRQDDSNSGIKASGRKLAKVDRNPGLSPPLQNSPESEFADGWREKEFRLMTEAEVERWFEEMLVVVGCKGAKM